MLPRGIMERLQVYYNQLFPKLFQHPLQASATSSQTLLLSEIQRGWGSQPQVKLNMFEAR